MSDIELKDVMAGRAGGIEALVERMQQLERRRTAAITLLRGFAQTHSRHEFLARAVRLLREWSACVCVGIRVLDEHGGIPYEAYVGFSEEFWRAENSLSIRHDRCACVRVIAGTPDPADAPVTSAGGSFWCNDTEAFMHGLPAGAHEQYRGTCIRAGYKTVAVVPIRYRDQVLGAVHLADERADALAPATLEFIEGVAPLIGEAVQRYGVEDTIRHQADLIESVSDAIISTDANQVIRSWNRAAQRIYGFAPAEVIGRPAREIFRASMSARRRDRIVRRIVDEGAWQGELRQRHKDGTPVDVLASATALRDEHGQPAGMVVVITDITALKRAQETLRKREEYHRTLLENALDIVLVLDRRGVVRYANPAVERWLGMRPQELVGHPVVEILHPDDAAAFAGLGERVRAAPDAVSGELRCRHRDGTWRHFEGQGKSLYDGRRWAGYIVNVHDVTERRRIMEQLLQAQKMEALGRLAGGVAHDFNNLLMVIKGYAALIRDEVQPAGQLGVFVEEILKAANRAARLPQQLLAFSRRQVLEQKVVCLGDLVLDMDRMLRRLIGEDVELLTLPAPGTWLVKVDPGQIEQVVVNLVVNARDAMPQGGRLTVSTANVEPGSELAALLPEAPAGNLVMLAVADTGAGMTAEVQRHLFEPFFTTKAVGRGTGLGLATVYGIVKQHQGTAVVQSEPGAGTVFRVFLPRAAETQAHASRPTPTDGLPRGRETVLLAEDEPTLRAMLVRILGRLGYTVIDATNGEEALRRAAEHPGDVHLLVTDLVMPLMGGRELQERLIAARPGVRTLFISGYADGAILREGERAPGTAFLAKPFDDADLARKVRELLDA